MRLCMFCQTCSLVSWLTLKFGVNPGRWTLALHLSMCVIIWTGRILLSCMAFLFLRALSMSGWSPVLTYR